MSLFQDVILSQWLIMIALGAVFIIVSRWALTVYSEYPGYILGWLIGAFFIIVRLSVGDADRPDGVPQYLDSVQVFVSTLMGLGVGAVIVLALRFGMSQAQAVSLQVAIYTGGLIIMLFTVFIGTPVAQKMIGIFGLAIGIATLFAMVLFPSPKRKEQLNLKVQSATGASQPINTQNPAGQGGGMPQNGSVPQSRLDQIRKRQNQKLGR
ncbi:MAG: hypothetical protein AAFV93_18305 [Chloroflexota bacterium]